MVWRPQPLPDRHFVKGSVRLSYQGGPYRKVNAHLDNALGLGARLATAPKDLPDTSRFASPLVLTGVTAEMRLSSRWRERNVRSPRRKRRLSGLAPGLRMEEARTSIRAPHRFFRAQAKQELER